MINQAQVKFHGTLATNVTLQCTILDITLTDGKPFGRVQSPFGLCDTTLCVSYHNGQWVCDID